VLTVTSGIDLRGTVGARMHHGAVTDDEPAPTTVRDRPTAAGLSDDRIQQHMTAGRVRVDGEPVTDLHAPAPAGTRVVAGRSDQRREPGTAGATRATRSWPRRTT